MTSASDPLAGLDPFDIFDTEATRLDRYFASLDEEAWNRPSRCEGWSVRDVLAHLAGEELYNHACLDGDIEGFFEMLEREGVRGGFVDFNEWCVRKRHGLPVEQVLQEWRDKNAETRERMRGLGRDATLGTSAGPYPVGLQTFHYDSEYATHADDVGAPVGNEEAVARVEWRVEVGLFALAERGSDVQVERVGRQLRVRVNSATVDLSPADFVEATVSRLPAEHPLDRRVRSALRCLA
ncbi:maleylpyruvate isomerase family mycothiol-dependent enzyme [Planotetraspora sp. A-T 1434]|uniref:maleylpyruvate isomerase family mycothiol-dependent enzyme n=1 Tax=Planotetraspora sp. A-T 1434 TaxID=2979219 RepID=UPI0021BF98BF|nr:maleylpyruvate isomerase family mycothiol-dependent enzyme [Planotetraspora sp. A-T 1434]MCT9935222.1 maleylpyruvate isomerase family mycothiol-dependent enzyme [Planotetraspora sp. A-T 1434]